MTIPASRLSGIPREFHAVARRYIAAFDAAGVPSQHADRLIAWGANYRGTREELVPAFRAQAQRLGLDADLTGRAEHAGLTTMDTPPDAAQGPDENARLLEDIRQYSRNYPDEYAQDAEMQRARLALTESQMSGVRGAPIEPLQGQAIDSRLKELRQMVRDDPNAMDRNPSLREEWTGLLGQQMAGEQAAEAAPAPTQAGTD